MIVWIILKNAAAYIAVTAIIVLAAFLLRKKIRITHSGLYIRRHTFKGEGGNMIVADNITLFGKEPSRRSLFNKGGCSGSVPTGKDKTRLLYAVFCKEILALFDEKKIKKTLTLGGGAGAVPFYTVHRFGAEADVIEINKTCIEVSEKYFTQGTKVNYICGDALEESKKLCDSGQKYQFVFCDLFVDFEPAKIVYDLRLMEYVSALIGDEGVFVMNGTNQNVKNMKRLITNSESSFRQTAVFSLKNMFVLCACNRTDIELIKAGNPKNRMFPVYPKTPFGDLEN